MAKIVVLGGGVGGVSAAYEARETFGKEHEVILVSDSDYFEFTPSNPWVAVKWRTPEQIKVNLAETMPKHGVRFIGTAADEIKAEENTIVLAGGDTVHYDYLIIASGPDLAFDEIEGMGPHDGYTASVCKTGHAAMAGDKFEEFCANPQPIVVGAAQGASCYGPAYEYAFILDTELRKRKIRRKVPITFVTAEPYIGHLGLDGVGDTKGMLESEMRDRDIKWICNSRIDKFEQGKAFVTQINTDGSDGDNHELNFGHCMVLPAFRGIKPLMGIEGLVNPRGFVLVDQHQRNPKYENIFAVGVCVAIPPVGPTPVPVGVPKTGYMIESMVTASVLNLQEIISGQSPTHRASWNAFCLADFGDRGMAFIAEPQIPPRNTNWSGSGRWVHWAKVAFEKYFLRKVRKGSLEPVFEKVTMRLIGLSKLRHKQED